MHSKCHDATDPVTRNDYLVPVSIALYSISSLWDVVLMLVCVGCLTNKHHLESRLCPHTAGSSSDRVFRWWLEIMN